MIEKDYPVVGGYPTLRLQSGKESNRRNILAFIICGNPGVAEYYEKYMNIFEEECQGKIPMCCISHAGHGMVPKDIPKANEAPKESLLNLEGQIKHKMHYINNYIPKDTKLILIGHSIGCYVILHLLDQLEEGRVLKCMMLFPTIERMAMSPKGRSTTPMLKYFRWMVPFPMYPAHYMVPDRVKEGLIKWYFKGTRVPDSAIKATMKITDPASLQTITHMANQEMQQVVKADYDIIDRHMAKLMWYYGATDHWCPVEYYEDMKMRYPEMDVLLCKEKFDHAFVLEDSDGMAKISWEWLQENVAECKNGL